MAREIQNRDRELLKFIYAFRVATFSQIHRRHFKGIYRTAGPRRVRQLEKAGYLKTMIAGVPSCVHRYASLTEKAWLEIRELWPFEVDKPLLQSESPLHDIHLAELSFAFEKLSSFKQLLTENLLQSSSALEQDPKFAALARLNADGALVLEPRKSEEYVYGVELEINRKSPERYRDKLLDYYMATGIDGVLYISDSQIILDAVARADSEVRSSRTSILHMALEKNVLISNGRIRFTKPQGTAIELF